MQQQFALLYIKDLLFKLVPAFDENLSSLEDWDFHFMCAKKKLKFHFFKSVNNGVLIRIHKSNMLVDKQRTLEAHNFLMKKIRSSLSDSDVDYYRDLGLPIKLLPKLDHKHYSRIKKFINRLLWRDY